MLLSKLIEFEAQIMKLDVYKFKNHLGVWGIQGGIQIKLNQTVLQVYDASLLKGSWENVLT